MEIVDFVPEYAAAFERLNLEWLEKYFWVEEVDRAILSNPQLEVIEHGGHILFVKVADEVVGTVALKHHGQGRYELTTRGRGKPHSVGKTSWIGASVMS